MVKILGIILAISLAANALLVKTVLDKKPTDKVVNNVEGDKNYPFLAKRIFADNPNDIVINFKPLRSSLNEYYNKVETGTIGVYFEYLPTGSSIGINEKKEFPLASLIKTPVAIAAMKMVEEGKMNLDDKIKLQPSDISATFGSLWKKGAGYEITVDEAIKLSLIESDNTASVALYRIVGLDNFVNIFESLDVPQIVDSKNILLTPKSFASIFKSLYFSSFLSYESSDKLLNILSQSIFKDKLVAGIPNSVKVAHKIGIKDDRSAEKPVYSDCGIVYVPQRQYFLCIMTEGIDETTSKNHIRTISEMAYTFVSKTN